MVGRPNGSASSFAQGVTPAFLGSGLGKSKVGISSWAAILAALVAVVLVVGEVGRRSFSHASTSSTSQKFPRICTKRLIQSQNNLYSTKEGMGRAGFEPTIHRYRRSDGKSSTQACHQTFCRLTTGACCLTCLGYLPIRTNERLTGIKSSTQLAPRLAECRGNDGS